MVISTLTVGIKKPALHKNIIIYNSDYIIVEQEEKPDIVKTEKTALKPVQTETKKTEVNNNTAVKKQTKTPKTLPVEKEEKKQVKKETPKQVKETKKETEKKENVKPVETKPVVSVQTEVNETEEETILWNKWRSDIQNQIMRDVKLPIMQEGITFKFSFDVNKYGKVSNIKTYSLDPAYTHYAIEYIAPVIRSYQGKNILNFPEGSKRYSTTAQGAWKISKTTKYSSPKDFNDKETIIKNN